MTAFLTEGEEGRRKKLKEGGKGRKEAQRKRKEGGKGEGGVGSKGETEAWKRKEEVKQQSQMTDKREKVRRGGRGK